MWWIRSMDLRTVTLNFIFFFIYIHLYTSGSALFFCLPFFVLCNSNLSIIEAWIFDLWTDSTNQIWPGIECLNLDQLFWSKKGIRSKPELQTLVWLPFELAQNPRFQLVPQPNPISNPIHYNPQIKLEISPSTQAETSSRLIMWIFLHREMIFKSS